MLQFESHYVLLDYFLVMSSTCIIFNFQPFGYFQPKVFFFGCCLGTYTFIAFFIATIAVKC